MTFFNLNESQNKSICHFNGPMAVLAGPGSGKTTVIIYRVRELIYNFGIDPNEIAVLTFNRISSYDMKRRYEIITSKNSEVLFSTFHSLFFKILKYHINIKLKNILKEKEKKEIIIRIIRELNFIIDDEEEFVKKLILEMSFVANEVLDINSYISKTISIEDFKKIYMYYIKIKKKLGKIDFDDITLDCYKLLSSNKKILQIWQNRYKYILIDEFQDINKVQYEIIKLIVYPKNNLYVVGDDDQSIYGFRGSKPEFLINFNKDFLNAKISILKINYRSTEEIIKVANKIISDNKIRYKKVIEGTNKKGKIPKLLKFHDANSEALNIAIKIKKLIKNVNINDICIIYRNNIQAYVFIDIFSNLNIPYKLKDEFFMIYNHWMCKDLCSYMKLALDRYDNISFERIVNKPKRYISRNVLEIISKNYNSFIDGTMSLEFKKLNIKQVARINEISIYLDKIVKMKPYNAIKYIRKVIGYDNYIEDYSNYRRINNRYLFDILDELQECARNYDSIEIYLNFIDRIINDESVKFIENNMSKDSVTLTTMHSVKGLEFEVVFIVGCVEGIIPHEKAIKENDIEEERRLFYISVTRAKSELYISTVKFRYEKEVKPTRFLNKIIEI